MSQARLPLRAIFALGLAAWTQACYAYRAAPPGAAGHENAVVRVRSAQPFPLRTVGAAPDVVVLCQTREVVGVLRRAVADTIVLDLRGRTPPQSSLSQSDQRCPSGGDVAIAVTPQLEVAVSMIDVKKTALSLVIIAVAVLAFAAYAASQIEYGFPAGLSAPPSLP